MRLEMAEDGWHATSTLRQLLTTAWTFLDKLNYKQAKLVGKVAVEAFRNEENSPKARFQAVANLMTMLAEEVDRLKEARDKGRRDQWRMAKQWAEGVYEGVREQGEDVDDLAHEAMQMVLEQTAGKTQHLMVARMVNLHRRLMDTAATLEEMIAKDENPSPKRPRHGKKLEAEITRLTKEHGGQDE